jgi:transcriptional regulator with XRE-family HTH domain
MDITAGDRLRGWRQRHGLTQQEAAARLREVGREMGFTETGFGQGRISEWERRISKPDLTGRQVIERATKGKGVIRIRDWDSPPPVSPAEASPSAPTGEAA